MAMFMLSHLIFQKLSDLCKSHVGDTLNIYEVYVSDDRNYLGPERHLLELYFRAKNKEEAIAMLELFKQKFHYPKYFEPIKMGVMRFQILFVFPRNHNVLWREKVCNKEYHFCSAEIAKLNS